MTEFDNTNSGALFNAENRKTEKSPTRNGSLNVKCPDCGKSHDFWLSGWDKVSKAGRDFVSLAIQLKDGTRARPEQFAKKAQDAFGLPETPKATVRGGGFSDLSDEVPFNKEWR